MYRSIQSSNKPVNIYDYIDYRRYLTDYYTLQKKQTRYFSYRYFSQKAGFSSHNVLKLVIRGQRNIALKSIEKFTKALCLDERESAYFRLMVRFHQTKNEVEKNALFLELSKYKKGAPARRVNELQYQMYSEWYVPVLREMITLKNFTNDHTSLAGMFSPPIRPTQVRKGMNLLEEIGLIRQDESGQWVQCDSIIRTDPELNSLSIRNFNRTMIHLAEKAIQDVPPAEREISGLTVAISQNSFRRIKEKIQKFKDELLADIAHDAEACDQIYQINFQLFPVLKTRPSDESAAE